jgi:SWI/SNF-related matrix-associated actin-dependent regulator of chromatin subfamily A member 5
MSWSQKSQNYIVPTREPEEGETPEEVEAERVEEQERINNGKLNRTRTKGITLGHNWQVAEPLTEEEVAEKDTLAGEGFLDWKRNHYLAFIKGLERYGRDSLDKVAAEIPDHSEEDVREYAAVFFERYKEVKGESTDSFDLSIYHVSKSLSLSRRER